MRIVLFTNGLEFGGAERIVEALAHDLRNQGDQVVVVASTRGGPLADELRRAGHSVYILGLRGIWDVSVIPKLNRIIQTHQADIVHSHLAVSDILSTAAPWSQPKNFVRWPLLTAKRDQAHPHLLRACPARVTTIHNPGVELFGLKKRLWPLALRQMHRVMAVSQAVRSQLPPLNSVQVVPPSLVDLHQPVLSKQKARARLGLDPHRPVIMTVGRLARIKGVDLIPDIVRRIKTQHFTYTLIGDGPLRSMTMDSPIQWIGPRHDAADLISAADVLVMPSRSEGFPQVPLLAMKAQVPVIATRVGGTPEVVIQGQTGQLVPDEDPDALAAAIDQLLNNPGLARRLGQAGYKRLVHHQLTRAAMVSATRSIYEEALAECPPR